VPYLCNDGASVPGTSAKESVAPVLASESTSSLPGITEDPLEAYSYTREKEVGQVSNMPEGL